mmetsp:Transcript_72761/g.213233  ORF Transcript_72761/g.213233 Transcript_72761/m.213233 type:complete len:316 (+) Transcript_72761:92-1039(+)
MPAAGRMNRRNSGHAVLLSALAALYVLHGLPQGTAPPRSPGLAIIAIADDQAGFVEAHFVTKVVGAAAQGATAAFVAAILSACTEPLVNRLLVKRMTFGEAFKEINFALISNFFLTTFPTNMLKFPAFEVINMLLSLTSLSGPTRGIVNGLLFCTMMLPVTNYRFRKSMGWEIKLGLLYQAYVPTVTRDIVYGWARGFCGSKVIALVNPTSALGNAFAFGLTISLACIISSPGNEWRGYTLQPKDRKLPFTEYFKPVNYVRSTGVGALIMGIALMTGQLVTPYAEMLFGFLKGHTAYAFFGLILIGCVAGVLKKK